MRVRGLFAAKRKEQRGKEGDKEQTERKRRGKHYQNK